MCVEEKKGFLFLVFFWGGGGVLFVNVKHYLCYSNNYLAWTKKSKPIEFKTTSPTWVKCIYFFIG